MKEHYYDYIIVTYVVRSTVYNVWTYKKNFEVISSSRHIKMVCTKLGALILEHVSEIMADTCNVSTRQKN